MSTTMFELTKEHEDLRHVVREFAADRIAPHAAEWDAQHRFPVELVPMLGDLGLLGLLVPEEYGGGGGDVTSLCVAVEELGRVDQSAGITLAVAAGLSIGGLVGYGTHEQKARWLPDLVAGRRLAAFALTEPDSGSQAGAPRTRARLEGGSWVIDGSKAFITNSGTPITSVITVLCRTGQARPADGDSRGAHPEVSALLVPAGSPGLVVEPAYRKLGWHASDTHGITFTGCAVPAQNLLGQRGRGYAQFLAGLDQGRVVIAALALGLAEACLAAATSYAVDRTAFGRPIGSNQGVAFPLADLAVATQASRLLTYRAAWLLDEQRAGRRPSAEVKQAAAAAKLYAARTAVQAANTAVQVLGGNGFIEEFPVARYYRDAKVLEIGEGTNEVQRLVLSRGLGLPV